jgi:hypothetical protein
VKSTAVTLIKCQIEDKAQLAHGVPGDGDPHEPEEENDYHSGHKEESTGFAPEDYGEGALDLSGSNAHRISPDLENDDRRLACSPSFIPQVLRIAKF